MATIYNLGDGGLYPAPYTVVGAAGNDIFNTSIEDFNTSGAAANPNLFITGSSGGTTNLLNFTDSGFLGAGSFYGILNIEEVNLASAGANTIYVSGYMLNQAGWYQTLTINGGNAGNTFDMTGMFGVDPGAQLVVNGGTSNNTYVLTAGDLPSVTINGNGSLNYMELVGGGVVNLAASGNVHDIQTIALDSAGYFLTVANAGTVI